MYVCLCCAQACAPHYHYTYDVFRSSENHTLYSGLNYTDLWDPAGMCYIIPSSLDAAAASQLKPCESFLNRKNRRLNQSLVLVVFLLFDPRAFSALNHCVLCIVWPGIKFCELNFPNCCVWLHALPIWLRVDIFWLAGSCTVDWVTSAQHSPLCISDPSQFILKFCGNAREQNMLDHCLPLFK